MRLLSFILIFFSGTALANDLQNCLFTSKAAAKLYHSAMAGNIVSQRSVGIADQMQNQNCQRATLLARSSKNLERNAIFLDTEMVDWTQAALIQYENVSYTQYRTIIDIANSIDNGFAYKAFAEALGQPGEFDITELQYAAKVDNATELNNYLFVITRAVYAISDLAAATNLVD